MKTMITAPLTIPCMHCGKPTLMLATKECDGCHELRVRIACDPDMARRMLGAEAFPDLLQGAQLLLDAASPHMTHRNAKERRAYEKLRAAVAKTKGQP